MFFFVYVSRSSSPSTCLPSKAEYSLLEQLSQTSPTTATRRTTSAMNSQVSQTSSETFRKLVSLNHGFKFLYPKGRLHFRSSQRLCQVCCSPLFSPKEFPKPFNYEKKVFKIQKVYIHDTMVFPMVFPFKAA